MPEEQSEEQKVKQAVKQAYDRGDTCGLLVLIHGILLDIYDVLLKQFEMQARQYNEAKAMLAVLGGERTPPGAPVFRDVHPSQYVQCAKNPEHRFNPGLGTCPICEIEEKGA